MMERMMFRDRAEAGRELASRLLKYRGRGTLVVALPRGGVEVALPVARALEAPLQICVAKKIGFPGQRELAIGAITAGGSCAVDTELVNRYGIHRKYLVKEAELVLHEAKHQQALYQRGRQKEPLDGKTVIVVDDGVATGWTALAACREIRLARPARLLLAVPVISSEAQERLRKEADEVIALVVDEQLVAVGNYYLDFHQLTDGDVFQLLAETEQPVETGSKLHGQ